jgi:outer membrane protein assembly factor BamB
LLALWLLSACPLFADWPQYRGANHDGVSHDRINKQWSGAVTNPVWRVPATNGLSSFAIGSGAAYTQIRREIGGVQREVCVALRLTDGFELWSANIGPADYPNGGVGPDDGPRSTPTVDNGSVYVLSTYLVLQRLNATNGALIWSTNLLAGFGGTIIPWQSAASPLLENGLIYVNANAGTARLMALRASDGSLAWRSQNEAMTHSTPVAATIHGVRQIIFAAQTGLVSVDPLTGARLWKSTYPFNYSTSLAVSPVVWDDLVFVSGAHSYGMRSVVIQVAPTNNNWTVTQLWSTNNPAAHWMTPVVYQGFLFGQFGIQQFDSPTAQLTCIDMRTGTVQWATNGFGRGGTLLVDDHLVSLTEMGDLVLVKPDTNSYVELGRFTAIPDFDQFTNRCWNSPAISDGRVYARSTAFGAAFDFSVPNLKIDPLKLQAPNLLQLSARTSDGTPLDSNRAALIELLASPELKLDPSLWTRLTNPLALSNGVLYATNVSRGNSNAFFILSEPR